MSSDPIDPGEPTQPGNPAAPPKAAPIASPAPTPRPLDRRSAGAVAVIGGLGVIAVVVSALIWVIAGHLHPQGSEAGAANPELLEIEQILDRLSFPPGKVDGVFDQETAKAIEAYQQAARLSVDGQPSIMLLNELRKAAAPATP